MARAKAKKATREEKCHDALLAHSHGEYACSSKVLLAFGKPRFESPH